MESTAQIEPHPRSKRPLDYYSKFKLPVSRKRKEIAEIVLVLSAMGNIRGGKGPTVTEKEMMVEARELLAEICSEFSPKDVFPSEGFGGVVDDLGLNKLKEEKLGFLPPKLSISEKLRLAKIKMEKAEELSLPSASYSSQQSQTALGTATESRNASHVKMFPQPSHAVNSSGSLQPVSPLGLGTPVRSASLPYQLPPSEVRPLVTGGVVSGNIVRDSSSVPPPRVGMPPFRIDGQPSGSSHTLQVEATTGNHSAMGTPTWSLQPASVSAANLGADTKLPLNATIKVEGGADVRSVMAPQVTISRPFITQSTSGNSPSTNPHLQGREFTQAPPARNTHSEIGKTIQKLLQPLLPNQPTWTAPSRDYMNKALTCKMCKCTIYEVDNVLICDACEKGYHLKCLQTTNQNSVPRGEWHCGKCLSAANVKPLPPKYGRVMRTINASKMPTIAANGQARSSNSVEIPSQQFPGIQSMVSNAKESSARASLAISKQKDQGVGLTNFAETPLSSNGDAKCVSSTSELLHRDGWVGNVIHIEDQKHYYQSCRKSGCIYNVQEYALIRFEDEGLIPSKLLAMWEDIKAGTKWVTVSRCYFPSDLPWTVYCPQRSSVSKEVYLSNRSSKVMADDIQGPCKVLTPSKFNEERERLARQVTRLNGGFRPLYVCKWMYDESERQFHNISC